ncbi:hypothetical protein BKA70DRAFT_1439700 [Coprinopsis sp. MPI-PUGE-AT-0042]|nr:hypothetical protein BKA70DRAFT_1439700 [Coprinopsis sp. MPI-PUGE-AT-0042]
MPQFDHLPTRSYSLSEFCNAASQHYDEDDLVPFINFVLSGIAEDHQVVLDVLRDRVTEDDYDDLEVTRDYDSLLGIDSEIRIRHQALTIWPIARHSDTLKSNLHFKYAFENHEGAQDAPLHHIPNLALGKWRLHNLIRIFFLDLYSKERRSFHLSQEEQTDFYEKGLRPALKELLEARGGELPPDYEGGLFVARQQKTGQLTLRTQILPEWQVPRLSELIRSHLAANNIHWGAHIAFLHEIRGVKDETTHLPMDVDNADVALEDFLDRNGLKLEWLTEGKWLLDVGLEVASRSERCLAWRTDHHNSIVQQIGDIPARHANRITENTSSKYNKDPASHLTGAAGFRITPGVLASGPHNIAYMQAYTTDKAVTYRPESGRFAKFTTAQQLINGKGKTFLPALYRLFRVALDTNFSCARAEARVDIKNATTVLMDIDFEVFSNALLVFEKNTWWSCKSWRALALHHLNDWQTSSAPALRILEPALLLTAGIAWMTNGLHARPDDGSSSRELMNAILPRARRDSIERDHLPFPITLHVAEEEEGSSPPRDGQVTDVGHESFASGSDLVPHIPYGMYFLRQLRLDTDIPRLYNHIGTSISAEAFWYLFDKHTFSEIEMTILRSRTSIPAHPGRNATKRNQALVAPPMPGDMLDFNLEAAGHSLGPAPRDDGSDLDPDSNDEDDGGDAQDMSKSLDAVVHRIWIQFLVDTICLIPNRKPADQEPYCVLPIPKRLTATIEVYQTLNLATVFNDVQYLRGSTAEWKRAFNHLFPSMGVKKKGTIQNYGKAPYFALWEKLKGQITEEVCVVAKKALWEMVKTLNWMPFALSDRIWATAPLPDVFKKFRGLPNGPAPQVLVRGPKPIWNPDA